MKNGNTFYELDWNEKYLRISQVEKRLKLLNSNSLRDIFMC